MLTGRSSSAYTDKEKPSSAYIRFYYTANPAKLQQDLQIFSHSPDEISEGHLYKYVPIPNVKGVPMPTRPPLLFEGCATALVTPFCDGKPDKPAFLRLLRHQIENRVDALVICGTTGESPTLTDAEKHWLFTAAVREAENAPQKIPEKILTNFSESSYSSHNLMIYYMGM